MGWDVGCGEGDGEEEDSDAGVCQWIGGRDCKKKSGQEAGKEQPTDDSENHSGESEFYAMGENAAKDLGGDCAKSHADADFASLKRNEIGNHAVNADKGEKKTE